MRITGRVSISGVSSEAARAVHQMVLEEVEAAAQNIVKRTKLGRDIHGRAFVKYSPGYRKFKIRRTGTGKVNLKLTGHMLESIEAQVERRSNTIEWCILFSNDEAEQKAIWNSVRRPFFGITKVALASIRIQASAILRYWERREKNGRAYA